MRRTSLERIGLCLCSSSALPHPQGEHSKGLEKKSFREEAEREALPSRLSEEWANVRISPTWDVGPSGELTWSCPRGHLRNDVMLTEIPCCLCPGCGEGRIKTGAESHQQEVNVLPKSKRWNEMFSRVSRIYESIPWEGSALHTGQDKTILCSSIRPVRTFPLPDISSLPSFLPLHPCPMAGVRNHLSKIEEALRWEKRKKDPSTR